MVGVRDAFNLAHRSGDRFERVIGKSKGQREEEQQGRVGGALDVGVEVRVDGQD
jgi:hypothetical protein